ncbi:MAG TPA: hypothetical protein VMZ27_14045 [Candidatus Saccharimonadales bacterium]|nr:hypothetical protein [Candidatus Saccharimonadales bacterium]
MPAKFLKSKVVWIGSILLVAFGVMFLYVASRSDEGLMKESMPSPNGLDDFLAAESTLRGGLPNLAAMSADDLRVIVGEHAGVLTRARQGLAQECRMPLDYSPGALTNTFDGLALSKTLGLLLREEGRLAERNMDYARAFQCYLDTLQFAAKRFRGGLIIHKMVGAELAKPAAAHIDALVPNLNAEQCRKGVVVLLQLDQAEESSEAVLQRDYLWARRASKLSSLQTMLTRILPQFRKTRAGLAVKLELNTILHRDLLIRLATRAFELERGKRPLQVSELVPQYLPAVPRNPTTGAELTLGR